jgi:diguanylate cyclase (GGDEF)-like protein
MEEETILVIEHDLLTANLLAKKLLPGLGYKARVAIDGKSAVWLANTQPVSLILLDIDLPDMDPVEVLREINSKNNVVPTIFITAGGDDKIDVETLHWGAQNYLQKPIDAAKINAALNRAFSAPQLEKEKTRLKEQFVEQVSWMKALTKIGQSVTSTLELDEVLRRIVEAGVELTHAEEGFLALLDEPGSKLYLRAAKNIDEGRTNTMRLPVSDSLIGQVVQTRRPIRTSQLEEQPALKVATGFLVQNLLHVPIVSKGKVLGVLSVDNRLNKHTFTEMDEAQLTSLADYAAVALENAHLYQRAQEEIKYRIDAEEKLLYDALHDSLTGLPNRALFMDRLRQALERSKRHTESIFAVLLLDLDRFKNVNDSLGHSKGDELLISVAQMLQENSRPTDTVARVGGDEFVILLEDIIDISDASRIADRIQEKLNSVSAQIGRGVFITTSIGVVLSVSGYENPEDMLRDADIAMYRAKALGKARYEYFDPAMRERILDRLKIERDLHQAVEMNELRVYYQPIVSLSSRGVAGFESLTRWQHPERGLLQPSAFISVAEETGLIIAMDEWGLQEACNQIHAWQKELNVTPPLIVSANITSKHLSHPDLLPKIQQILQDTGLEARRLKLEITENTIMENIDNTVALFARMQALGVNIQIDDFGVGYSSLNYLSKFPVNAIKIDRSFVQSLTKGKNHEIIAQAIVMLAHGLNMEVIAEGVETGEQFNLLRNLGCEYAQGAYISMPMDAKSAYSFLVKNIANQAGAPVSAPANAPTRP